MTTIRPLATVGRYGRKLHAIDAARPGLVVCNNSDGPYLFRDDDGGYTDKTRTSALKPVGRTGVPTCAKCVAILNRQ